MRAPAAYGVASAAYGVASAAAVACLVLAGCGGCGHHEPEGGGDTAPHPPEAPRLAVIVGHVTLADGAELPYYPDYMIPQPPGHAPPPAECPPPRQADHQPIRLDTTTRGLVGVMVAATEFDTSLAPHADPVTRDLDIRDCLMTPQFVVANVGDTLRVTNHSAYPYFPSVTGYGGMTQALIRDAPPRDVALDHPGITQAGCSALGVSCGRSDVIVLSNPVWSLSEASGTFRIANVPPGAHVQVHAWHPLFEEAMQTLEVHAGEEQHVELVLHPAALPPPPEPPPPHDPNQIGDIH